MHGAGTKRNIKFDESNLSLYMDVNIPTGNGWMRVSPAMARQEKDANQQEEERKTRRKLRAPMPVPTGGNAAALMSKTPAGQPLVGGHNGKTPNFADDLEKLQRKYSQFPTGRNNGGENFGSHRGPGRGQQEGMDM